MRLEGCVPMRVAVTGAGGRVGQFVVDELLVSGHEVIALSRRHRDDCPVEQRTVDILNATTLSDALKGCEAIVHLAALPSPMSGDAADVFASNAQGTFNVLTAAADLGIHKVSIASSDCAWGFTFNHVPFVPHYFPIDEAHPAMPDNCYGLGKLCMEKVADGLAQRYSMSVATCRITHVVRPFEYGPGQRFRQWIDDPSQGPRNMWAYIDARDAAKAFRLGIEVELDGHQVFSINSSVNRCSVPVEELLQQYQGVELRRPINGHDSLLDNSKARRLLGWVPEHVWMEDINS